MYTQHCETKMGQLVPVENGPTVQLLGQGGDHKVTFIGAGDAAPSTMPSSEFFATHRQAYPAEIEAFEKKAAKPARAAAAEKEPAKT